MQRVLREAALLALLARSARVASSQETDATNFFLNPGLASPPSTYQDDSTYVVGSSIDIAWKTNYTWMTMYLAQQIQLQNDVYWPLFQNQTGLTSVRWPVSVLETGTPLNINNDVFYLQLQDFSNTSNYFTSKYFTIVANGQTTTQSVVTATIPPFSTQTVVQTTTIIPDTTLPFLGSGPSSTTSASASTSPTSAASDGLSSGAKIGIGIGVGVGGLGLAIGMILAFCFWRRGKRKAQEASAQHSLIQGGGLQQGQEAKFQSQISQQGYHGPGQYYGPTGELSGYREPQEMGNLAANWRAQELPPSAGDQR